MGYYLQGDENMKRNYNGYAQKKDKYNNKKIPAFDCGYLITQKD